MTKCLAGIVAASGGGSGPVPGSAATHYDGATDYFKRPGALAGSPPVAGTGTVLSAFTQINIADFGYPTLISSLQHFTAGFAQVEPYVVCQFQDDRSGTGVYRVVLNMRTAGGVSFAFISFALPADVVNDGLFHHILFGINFATGAYQAYLDDAPLIDVGDQSAVGGAPFTFDWSATRDWIIAGEVVNYAFVPFAGTFPEFSGCDAELWFGSVDSPPDFSIESNRRKFINADLTPADLGVDGSLPFGTSPIAYFPAGDGVNNGTGGDLSPVGAPSACSTVPDVYGTSATQYDGLADLYRLSGSIAAAPVAATGSIVSAFFRIPPGSLADGSFSGDLFAALAHYAAGFASIITPSFSLALYDDSGYVGATNKIRAAVQIRPSLGDYVYSDIGLPAGVDDNGFHSIVYGINTTTGAVQCYFDRSPVTDTDGYSGSGGLPFTVDWTLPPSWTVSASDFQLDPGARLTGGYFAQCQAELWGDFYTGAIPDLSDPAVLALFVNASNKPTGIKNKFGTDPAFYFRRGNGTNDGYAGDFDPVGTPSTCGSAP